MTDEFENSEDPTEEPDEFMNVDIDWREEKIMDTSKVLGLNMDNTIWLKQIRYHQDDILSTKTVTNPKFRKFFEYLYNEENPKQSKYRCSLCTRYAEHLHVSDQLKEEIASEEGTLKSNKPLNYNALTKHANNPIHKEIVKYVESLEKGDEVDTLTMIRPTVKLIKTVYSMILLKGGMSKIYVLTDLQNIKDKSHYKRDSAYVVRRYIHENIRNKIIKTIQSSKSALSIVLDSATDNSNQHFLIVYFSLISQQEKRMIFYKLIYIGSQSDAESLYKILLENFELDGLADVIQESLVAFVSDSAANFASDKHKSVAIKFDNWVKRKNSLIKIRCYSHRFQTGLGHSYQSFSVISDMNDFISNIGSYFFGYSYKRQALLRELAQSLNEKMYKINNVFKTRWIASSYTQVRNLLRQTNLLIIELKEIRDSNEFKKADRLRAKEMWSQLLNKNFLLAFYFNYDILEIFKRFSLSVQQGSAIFNDINFFYNRFVTDVVALNSTDGPHMHELFKIVNNGRENKIENSDDFENSENLQYYGNDLTNDGIKLSEFRNDLITSITLYTSDLYPYQTLEVFEILEPNHLSRALYKENVKKLFNSFGETLTDDELDDFTAKIQKILDSPSFNNNQQSNLNLFEFWKIYLFESEISWSDKERFVIKAILSLPLSSSDAERG